MEIPVSMDVLCGTGLASSVNGGVMGIFFLILVVFFFVVKFQKEPIFKRPNSVAVLGVAGKDMT